MQDLKRIDLPDFDLCRILSNVFINAIESAARAEARTVRVTVHRRQAAEAVVAISNSIPDRVDISKIFTPGFSTKPGHSGHGLYQVNRILAKYYGCTIRPNCEGQTFTMYLDLPLRVMKQAE